MLTQEEIHEHYTGLTKILTSCHKCGMKTEAIEKRLGDIYFIIADLKDGAITDLDCRSRDKIISAFIEFLVRLPDKPYEQLKGKWTNYEFLFITKDTYGKCIHLPIDVNPKDILFYPIKIIFMPLSFKLSRSKFIAVIAHEIAHSFQNNMFDWNWAESLSHDEYQHDNSEGGADEMVIAWGFGNELKELVGE